MKLSECQHGVLVSYTNGAGVIKVGMVVGVTSSYNRAKNTWAPIPLIQWEDDKDSREGAHHSNLTLYND